MKKSILFLFLLCFLVAGISAQTNGRPVTTYANPVAFSANAVISAGPLFDLDAGHELRRYYTHEQGSRTHVKYQQFYQGLRVLSATVVCHLKGDALYATSGQLAGFSGLSVKPGLSIGQGEQLARLRLASQLKIAPGTSFEAGPVTRAVANANYPNPGGAYAPVFVYSLRNEQLAIPLNQDVIINANTGRVIALLDNIHTDATTGHGDGFYHSDLTFPVDSIAEDHFELRDESRGQGVFAYNISDNDQPFRDDDNEWSSEEEGLAAALDGYTGTLLFYDMLQERFGRNSLDDQGVPLIINMNRHSYVNAFWNGESANFGNGNCDSYSPLTTYEIVGHEYAHGLTQYTSGLIYKSESGAINEAISDIMGKALEFYYDNDHFNWMIGSLIRRDPNGRFFRSMSDPNERFHPKYFKGDFWRTDGGDNGGVHSKSGVLNYWFYLLVEGGSGTNQSDYAYDVSSIGMDDAIQLVYLLETAYLTENSGFIEAYQYTKLAAADLFGENSQQYLSAMEAWMAVGLSDSVVPDGTDGVYAVGTFATLDNDNTFDFELCIPELSDLTLSVELDSDTLIPAATVVTGELIFSYFDGLENFDDTIVLAETILPADQTQFSSFETPVSFLPTGRPDFIIVSGSLAYTSPVDELLFTSEFTAYLFLNNVTEVSLSYQSIEVSEACSSNPTIIDEYYGFNVPRCENQTEGLFRLVYRGLNGEEDIIEETIENDGDGSQAFFRLSENVDFARLGGLSSTFLDIYLITDEAETLLYREDYTGRFAKTIDEIMQETFVDEADARRQLGILGCASCAVDYGSGQLTIQDTLAFVQSEECVPVRDFVNTAVTREDRRLTNITLCLETAGIDNPHLVFDLLQENNDELSAEQNVFQHVVDVFHEGRSLLSAPITSTDGRMKPQEVELADGFSGTIQLHILSSQVNTTIDNLGIVSGSPSSVGGLPTGNFNLRFANPVGDQLELWAGKTVPAGTTVTIFSAAGQQLRQLNMTGERMTTPMADLPGGLYFLVVTDGQTFRWTGKAIKP